MKLTTSLVIFSSLIVGLYCATDLPSVVTDPSIPQVKPKTTASTTTASTTTTEESTSTSSTSTTAIPPSPTTTVTPSTSTSTTTPTTTSTTTIVPPTTIAPIPPNEKPKLAKYFVSENNVTCILVELATQLKIRNGNGTYKVINLPGSDDANDTRKKAEGSCGNGNKTEQYMVVEWPDNGDVNTMNMTFRLNTTGRTEFLLHEVVFNLSAKIFPNNGDRILVHHIGKMIENPKDKSYRCVRVETFNLTKIENTQNDTILGTFDISRVQIEAFRTTNTTLYSTEVNCEAMNTPDIVPIAVGIALIALVVVVLIAYLVGRRRAQSRGYVSM